MLGRTVGVLSVLVTVAGTSALPGIKIDTSISGMQRVSADASVVLIQVISLSDDSLYGNGIVVASGTVATERALLEDAHTVGIISDTGRAVLSLAQLSTPPGTNVFGAPELNEGGALVGIAFTTASDGVTETYAIPSR